MEINIVLEVFFFGWAVYVMLGACLKYEQQTPVRKKEKKTSQNYSSASLISLVGRKQKQIYKYNHVLNLYLIQELIHVWSI